jgi:hypothetical protein
MSKGGKSLRKSGGVDRSADLLDPIIQSTVTTSTERALYIANGLVTAVVPLYVYTAIFGLSLKDNLPWFLIGSGIIAYFISKAYETSFRAVYNSLAHQRNLFLTVADNQKQQASIDSQKEISKHEAISFSIVYNNLLFFVLLVFFGFFIFVNLSSAYNYVLTAFCAASLVSVTSTALSKPDQK